MKCLQETVTGKVTRVSDADARKKVITGKYEFVSKTVWKQKSRKILEVVESDNEVSEVKVHGLKAKNRKNKK